MPYPINAERLARKRQVTILKSLVWFHQGSNLHGQNPPISQNGRRPSHLVLLVELNWCFNSATRHLVGSGHSTYSAILSINSVISRKCAFIHRHAWQKADWPCVSHISFRSVTACWKIFQCSEILMLFIYIYNSLKYKKRENSVQTLLRTRCGVHNGSYTPHVQTFDTGRMGCGVCVGSKQLIRTSERS